MSADSPPAAARPPPTTTIPLSLTEDYAPSWGVWEGVRELIQNWHDGVLEHAHVASDVAWESHLDDDAWALQRCEARLPDGRSVGTCVFDPRLERLTLVNREVGLERRVLLLGNSKKALAAESIGQFGEGMKVGALALLREGRALSMVTRDERWQWTRREDPTFGVRVLTVEVSPRGDDRAIAHGDADDDDDAELLARAEPRRAAAAAARRFYASELRLGASDTCCVLSPITLEEWRAHASRFLFLRRPHDSFKCELGELLLDDDLQGQLYVKGVWISDLRADGLGSGLNFRTMRLDRDRRSITHMSDLESQAAAMWVRAIDARPELSRRLYALLDAPSPPSDVRRVCEFFQASERPTFVAAMEAEFFRHRGEGALPLEHAPHARMHMCILSCVWHVYGMCAWHVCAGGPRGRPVLPRPPRRHPAPAAAVRDCMLH